jgi:flagellar basal-body rod modification protein FlgD
MSTAPVTPTTPTSTTNGLPSGQSLNNMFLQLLVAQLQNQDPTSPVDPSQFVGQLAQFSELSEVTSIYTLLQQVVPASGGTGTSGTSPSSGSANVGTPNPATPNVANSTAIAAAASVLGGNISPGATPTNGIVPSFAAPAISSLTSKIQGAF